MLRSDAQTASSSTSKSNNKILNISIDAIAKIEKELDPYDVISLVFILYDIPHTALQRLIVYERVSKDSQESMNLLYEWAQHAQSRPSWRFEFLEALAICQLYNIIRKLGFNIDNIKKSYAPDDIQTFVYINPMKKALYKLCEFTTTENLLKLKNSLSTYDINVMNYANCELVLLELMCKKFIIIDILNPVQLSSGRIDIMNLIKIIENFKEYSSLALELKKLQDKCNNGGKSEHEKVVIETGTSKTNDKYNHYDDDDEDYEMEDNQEMAQALEDMIEYLQDMNLEDPQKHLKSDKRKFITGAYPIKNPKRIGVCYIINQEDFHPSKESIENNIGSPPLEQRKGTRRDKMVLDKTMTALNFEVISHQNLDHKRMMEYIKNIVQFRVHPDDSMFMLCILSHGIRGHVYAADSVKVKVDDIENLLDECLQERKLDIPKILILQACQVVYAEPRLRLVADSPTTYHLKKLNCLIYWATAPSLEAYRDEKKGSIFIQTLCIILQKFAKHEHLYDIFTKVTDGVVRLCTQLKKEQVPIFKSTLRKKLFLQIPEE